MSSVGTTGTSARLVTNDETLLRVSARRCPAAKAGKSSDGDKLHNRVQGQEAADPVVIRLIHCVVRT